MIMNIDKLTTIQELEDFLSGSQAIGFRVTSTKDETYSWIQKTLVKFDYVRLKRNSRGTLIQFICKVTNYSRQQITRLVAQYRKTGYIIRKQKTVSGFKTKYTDFDISLLASIDEQHETPNGAAVKKLLERASNVYNESAYKNISDISVSHIYNLRKSVGYTKRRRHFTKTVYKSSDIGQRRKPESHGEPGYIRIDTVHQGDLDGQKGVYHINAVDEVTQFEVVFSVEKISEQYLIPALEFILDQFPFEIKNFHSDNGSEYINRQVAKLLDNLLVEFTKSRPRHSNDNALAECKNAAVIRKIFGHTHIAQRHAAIINDFNKKYLIPYVNYHRPCYFPVVITDKKGKQKRTYPSKNVMTPFEKLKSLKNVAKYLKPGITISQLEQVEQSISDNKSAQQLKEARKLLFDTIERSDKLTA